MPATSGTDAKIISIAATSSEGDRSTTPVEELQSVRGPPDATAGALPILRATDTAGSVQPEGGTWTSSANTAASPSVRTLRAVETAPERARQRVIADLAEARARTALAQFAERLGNAIVEGVATVNANAEYLRGVRVLSNARLSKLGRGVAARTLRDIHRAAAGASAADLNEATLQELAAISAAAANGSETVEQLEARLDALGLPQLAVGSLQGWTP